MKITEQELSKMINESINEVFAELNEGKSFNNKNKDDFKKMRNPKGYNRKNKKDDNLEESKNQVKLTEAELTQLVAESTLRILKESDMDEFNIFNRNDRQNAKNKIQSFGKGAGAFLKYGGLQAGKSAYYDNRAGYMQNKADDQATANAEAEQQIRDKYARMKQQLTNQLNGLDAQMNAELQQVGQGQEDYRQQATNFSNNAKDARTRQYNFFNPDNPQKYTYEQ